MTCGRRRCDVCDQGLEVNSWIDHDLEVLFVVTWPWPGLTPDTAKEAAYAYYAGDHEYGIVSGVGDRADLASVTVNQPEFQNFRIPIMRFHVVPVDGPRSPADSLPPPAKD